MISNHKLLTCYPKYVGLMEDVDINDEDHHILNNFLENDVIPDDPSEKIKDIIFQFACMEKDASIIDLIVIKYYIDPKKEFFLNNNALLLCGAYNKKEVIEHFVDKYGMDIYYTNNQKSNIILFSACYNGTDVIDHIVNKYHFDIDYKRDNEMNALLYCTGYNGTKMFDHLIDKYKMDIDVRDRYDNNVLLMCALKNKNTDMFDHLINKYNMNLYHRNCSGANSLLTSAGNKNTNVFQYILNKYREDSKKININYTDDYGNNAVIYCGVYNNIKLLDYLVGVCGMDINYMNNAGEDIYWLSARNGSTDMLDHLINKYKFDVNTTKAGQNYLMVSNLSAKFNLKSYKYLMNKNAELYLEKKKDIHKMINNLTVGDIIFRHYVDVTIGVINEEDTIELIKAELF